MPENENSYDLKTLAEKLQEVRFTMFATRQPDAIRGRPMTVLEATDQGSLWFFGVKDSELVQEAAEDPQVSLSFADNGKGTYAFVSGRAYLRTDPAARPLYQLRPGQGRGALESHPQGLV